MGIFGGNKEVIDLSEPGMVEINDDVASMVPDPGAYFLNWIGDTLDDHGVERLKNEVDSRRISNGWLTSRSLEDVPGIGRQQVPLTFLDSMMGYRSISTVAAWATNPYQGRDLKALWQTIQSLAHNQGYAAAATWAITARPKHRLHLEDLQEALPQAWDEGLDWVRNKDILKAFQNWT